MGAQHLFPISFYPSFAFICDHLLPMYLELRRRTFRDPQDGFLEDVKIVNFSKQILNELQAVFPLRVVLWKKVLRYIAKFLQSDTQPMERCRCGCLESLKLKPARSVEPFQRQGLKDFRTGRQPCRAPRQQVSPAIPLFAIEILDRIFCKPLQVRLSLPKVFQQTLSCRIVIRTQLFHPLHQDMAVAQGSQAVKESCGLPAHSLPV